MKSKQKTSVTSFVILICIYFSFPKLFASCELHDCAFVTRNLSDNRVTVQKIRYLPFLTSSFAGKANQRKRIIDVPLSSRELFHEKNELAETNSNQKLGRLINWSSNDSVSQNVLSKSKATFVSMLLFLAAFLHYDAAIATESNPASISSPSTPPISKVTPISSSLKQIEYIKPKANILDSNSVLDEVWGIIDKYYVDRTFHDQNWSSVLNENRAKLKVDSSNQKQMQVTNEMVKSLGDKYSRLLDPEAYASIQKFDLIGVGANLMPDSSKRLMIGSPPLPNSAADIAGIKSGDYVEAVNGIATNGRTAFDIIDQISEDPNAKEIMFTVRRQTADDLIGEGERRDVVLQRAFTKVKDPIKYKISEKRKDGTVVGYIHISEFNALVKRQLEVALKDLESQGANAYVLDLRGNPGGAFQSAVEVASYFLDDVVATFVVDNNDAELPFKTAKGKVIVDKSDPISIWVDKRSASASEVLAGALHDNCRAVVMGETSFGKGLIQAVYGLKNGSGLVLTVARYVTPSGVDIQGTGIKPDINGGVPPSLLPGVTVINGDTKGVDFGAVRAKSKEICPAPNLAMNDSNTKNILSN